MRFLSTQCDSRWRSCVGTLAFFFLLVGCGRNSGKVVITNAYGLPNLVYDCSNFRPQIEYGEQLQTLAAAYSETVQHASAFGRVLTAKSLKAAWDGKEWLTVERMIVEYRCAHQQEFMQQ
jgi:hypothetical protein